MIFNFIILLVYTLLLSISLLGYGTLAFKYIHTDTIEDKFYVGEKAFYSLLFLIPLSLVIHFFFLFHINSNFFRWYFNILKTTKI